jgi:dTDP-4-amino-4,6-dideoxygalactose transaminase
VKFAESFLYETWIEQNPVRYNKFLSEKIKSIREYGWKDRVSVFKGRNSRLDEIQAAFLRGLLPMLDSWNQKRIKVAQRYLSELKNPKITLPHFSMNSYVGHIFPVFVTDADNFRNFLIADGIHTAIQYPIDDEEQFAWKNKTKKSPLLSPVSLPISQYLKSKQITEIISAINDY